MDDSELNTADWDKPYLDSYRLGSAYPGHKESYQKQFIVAPAKHYTTRAWTGNYYRKSREREYFGMTSSAAPVVSALLERLWTHSPKSTASDIGHAIYNGANQNFPGYTPSYYGEGMISFRGSLGLLQTSEYQIL